MFSISSLYLFRLQLKPKVMNNLKYELMGSDCLIEGLLKQGWIGRSVNCDNVEYARVGTEDDRHHAEGEDKDVFPYEPVARAEPHLPEGDHLDEDGDDQAEERKAESSDQREERPYLGHGHGQQNWKKNWGLDI